jgi:UDP-GlcNAc:undecaprenyl-phosphate/decaprenyl-phosphate GlcNAc-1-phosphate transferase
MYETLLGFLTAFFLTYFAIPSIIQIARVKNLCDEPGERRSHSVATPSLGGIGIFAGILFSVILWTPFKVFSEQQYYLCAFIVLFLIGAKDDIIPISPRKKLAGQILAACILVFKSNVLISSFYGVFGIYTLPYWVSVFISIFTIVVITNAFNLLDGINGLTGSIGTLICIVIGTWFLMTNNIGLAMMAFSTAGSLVAFLRYNFTPAKIFMGDTGALIVGTVCSILTIKFIEGHSELSNSPYALKSVPALAIGILVLPLFDTARVFLTRIFQGKSPFYPDRNHIHHLLIDSGLSHMQATGVLFLVNVVFIIMAFSLQSIGTAKLILVILAVSSILSWVLFNIASKKRSLISN